MLARSDARLSGEPLEVLGREPLDERGQTPERERARPHASRQPGADKLGIRDRYELAILGLKNLAVPEGAGAPMSHPHHNATLFVMRDDLRQEARWRS